MALRLSFHKEQDMVLVKGNSSVKELILNRPKKLNSLNYEMISQLRRVLRTYENDPTINLIIIKGNGKAFCTGGDIVAAISSSLLGHESYVGRFYRTLMHLTYLVAVYKKPLVCLIDGIVMGSGAGLAMNTKFRVVTEKAVFAMPEASIGIFPDVSASYYLSRLGGNLGEYVGLTGAKLNGPQMLACGLATHYVPSKDLNMVEKELLAAAPTDASVVAMIIDKFAVKPHVQQDTSYNRLDIINKCFSRDTIEEILQSLENELKNKPEKWIDEAIKSMRSSCPSSLKIFLKLIRGGRVQNLQQCLVREYHAMGHVVLRTFSNDFYEGSRAKLFDKDNQPKWEPSDLEQVTKPMVDRYFNVPLDGEYWEPLDFSDHAYNQLVKSRL